MKLRSAVYIVFVSYNDGSLTGVKHIEGVYAKKNIAESVCEEYQSKGYESSMKEYKVRF